MSTLTALISLGEIVWDIYPDRRLLGGAPFNVAAHAARLGMDARLISAVGNDELGSLALQQASELGVDTTLTRLHPALPTGCVDVVLDANKQPTFHLRRPAAWEEPALPGPVQAGWLVCGTLQQTCPQAARVRRELAHIPLFYDVNLRPSFEDPAVVEELLRQADTVKCNEPELHWLRRQFHLSGERDLMRRYQVRTLCVTLGARGCRIFSGDQCVEAPAPLVEPVDTVGAGDAFSAALLYGLSSGWPLERTARFANGLGALVASRHGAIPAWNAAELPEH